MQRRRKRRGFWGWSWILVITVALGVFGGRWLGGQSWSKLPKEYQATSVLSVKARPPFRASVSGSETVASIGTGELALVSAIRDQSAFARVVENLGLIDKWKVTPDEALKILRDGIQTTKAGDDGQVAIRATLYTPEDAKAVADEAAAVGSARISEVQEEERGRALLALDEELNELEAGERDSFVKVQEALAKKGITINPSPTLKASDLDIYLGEPNVLDTVMEWDRWKARIEELKSSQANIRAYWERPVPPATILKKADLPTQASGPDKAPFVQRGSLTGLIVGLVLGLGAMVGAWKFLK